MAGMALLAVFRCRRGDENSAAELVAVWGEEMNCSEPFLLRLPRTLSGQSPCQKYLAIKLFLCLQSA